MLKLTVRNLSRPQIDAFAQLFPKLHEAGLVKPKGTTALVIDLHPDVFRRDDRQASASEQLAASTITLWNNQGRITSGLQPNTVRSLRGKLRGLVAEEA